MEIQEKHSTQYSSLFRKLKLLNIFHIPNREAPENYQLTLACCSGKADAKRQTSFSALDQLIYV